jgi:hypothetical protein
MAKRKSAKSGASGGKRAVRRTGPRVKRRVSRVDSHAEPFPAPRAKPRTAEKATATATLDKPRGARSKRTPAAGTAAAGVSVTATRTHTVIFVHGIGNKPAPASFKKQWDVALFGTDMGARTRVAYWADIRYPQPLSGSGVEARALGGGVFAGAGLGGLGATPHLSSPAAPPLTDETIANLIADSVAPQAGVPEGHGKPGTKRGRAGRTSDPNAYGHAWAEALALKALDHADEWDTLAADPRALGGSAADRRGGRRTLGISAKGVNKRLLPLPGFARRWVAEHLTDAFIHDTHAYLFDAEQRRRMRERLAQLLTPENSPYVVIAHSQGSIIAYEVLAELAASSGVVVSQLITIGSPLGVQEVQDNLAKPLRVPAVVKRWDNFADLLDPVAMDKRLSGDFKANADGVRIEDELVVNRDSLRLKGFNPHSGAGYLETDAVRAAARDVLGTSFAAPLSKFVIAKDVAADMTESTVRLPVLIELKADDAAAATGLHAQGLVIRRAIEQVIVGEAAREAADIDVLRRFVAARLTAVEIDALAARNDELRIATIWKNAKKRKLIGASTHTLQAWTAQRGYCANGKKIAWAVLDTGIAVDHPHFVKHGNVKAAWDCTKRGPPQAGKGIDRDGHGTHVAGIIAGATKVPDSKYGELEGMAPQCALHGYKVLNDAGEGEDAWIIKALDHIAELNDNAPELVIQGVNLSLGGYFDPEVFGCGFSPICRELRRLWRQGVVVVLAAGNEGHIVVQTDEGEAEISLDLSIGDPANLDEAIAVGSVHKDHPHMYGISYFSSRGPTADGRAKPDCVAPGEKIISANALFADRGNSPDYVEMSGTSMACPHVSGLIAAFLSVRREFIGHPDHVKQILLSNCTDLKRDRYHQGAGMPNLVKMLTGT